MIDVHAHLAASVFDEDLPEVLSRSRKANVRAVVAVPENLQEFDRILRLSIEFDHYVAASAGIHPVQDDTSAKEARSVGKDEVEPVCGFIRRNHAHLVGVGEIGLDFSPRFVKSNEDKAAQRHVFTTQIALALEYNLPVNVHSRSAGRPALQLLYDLDAKNVVMHAFDGRPSVALEAVRRGYFFSIPPCVVRSEQKQKLAKQLPVESLLLETDSPALGPEKAGRNEPANLRISCEEIAKIKGIPADVVAEVTTANALRLFPKLKAFSL